MLWYVVQVRTGEERDIAAKLTDMGFQTLAPVENRPVRSGGAWGTKEYVLFPGYVFLQMDYNAGNYYRLKAVPGIVKLLSGTVLVKLFCNTLFDKYLTVTSLHRC